MSKPWERAMRQARRIGKSSRPRQTERAWANAVREALGAPRREGA